MTFALSGGTLALSGGIFALPGRMQAPRMHYRLFTYVAC